MAIFNIKRTVNGLDRDFTVEFNEVAEDEVIVTFIPGKAHTRSMDRDLRRPRTYTLKRIKALQLILMVTNHRINNYWFALDTASYFAS